MNTNIDIRRYDKGYAVYDYEQSDIYGVLFKYRDEAYQYHEAMVQKRMEAMRILNNPFNPLDLTKVEMEWFI